MYVKQSKHISKLRSHGLIILVCIFHSLSIFGQEIKSIAPFLIEYNSSYDKILRQKGMPIDYTDGKIYLKETVYNLNNLDKKNEIALLFYAYEDSTNNLNCWLIDTKGLQSHYETITTKEYLQKLEEKNFKSINRDFGQDSTRGKAFEEIGKDYIAEPNKKLSNIIFIDSLEFDLMKYQTILVCPILNLATIPWYALRPFDNENEFVVDHWNIQILESLNQLYLAPLFNDELGKWEYDIENIFIPNEIEMETDSMTDMQNSFFLNFPVEAPIVIGNPDYDGCGLKQLPGAEIEAEYVANKLNTKLLTDTNAVLKRITTYPGWFKDRFIYIASHGISSAEDPMNESCLFLSSKNGECNRLTAEEIISIGKLPMSLVILSACETGKGKVIDGGIVGLSRCFLLNRHGSSYPKSNGPSGYYIRNYGAQNVIMSLWNVDDEATKNLMKLFVDELCELNNSFPIAPLRKAILEYRKTDNNPNHWAAFQCMGLMFPNNWYVKLPTN